MSTCDSSVPDNANPLMKTGKDIYPVWSIRSAHIQSRVASMMILAFKLVFLTYN